MDVGVYQYIAVLRSTVPRLIGATADDLYSQLKEKA